MIIYDGGCTRGLESCQAIRCIKSDTGPMSFVCAGEIHPSSRAPKQDAWRLCWKNADVDEMGDYDTRDLADTMAVLSAALSVAMNQEA